MRDFLLHMAILWTLVGLCWGAAWLFGAETHEVVAFMALSFVVGDFLDREGES
jgi:hypothetical protein